MATTLLLTVYLLTWPILTCYTTPTCDKQKVVLKESLPISYYMNLYHKSLRLKPQPKPVAHIQQMTTSTQRPRIDIKCGTNAVDKIFQPVINGDNAPEKRYPWQVFVRGIRSICGGVLISSQWVLTAAHCINKTAFILLGTNDIGNYSWPAVHSGVIREIKHEDYRTGYNDIGMIKLSAEVQFNDYIRPACLPEYGANFVNVRECFLSGWGLTDFNNSISPDLLQEVRVSVISNKDCLKPYLYVATVISRQHLCTAVNLARGACQGDSGGPVSCLVGSSFYVAGLASMVEAGCHQTFLPDLYTRVSFYRDWITKIMAKN